MNKYKTVNITTTCAFDRVQFSISGSIFLHIIFSQDLDGFGGLIAPHGTC